MLSVLLIKPLLASVLATLLTRLLRYLLTSIHLACLHRRCGSHRSYDAGVFQQSVRFIE